MRRTRRTFLQQMGLTLTALGLSETSLLLMTDRYQQAIALPTRRKLALLVGINQYSEQVCDYVSSKGTALTGCLTDVALQQELLTHRFGFQSSDILTLTDQQATQQAIVDAFQAHLMEQARPGDVVVFHFSGLGSCVKVQNPGIALARFRQNSPEQISFVPVDGLLPTETSPVLRDLMAETLVWLLQSLHTEQITTLLDTGHTTLGRTLQGNLHIRSRPNAPSGQVSESERLLQEHLSRQTRVSREQVRSQWQSGQLPGLVLSAASPNQVTTEVQWNGFSAGLLTYALTQQLWCTTPATTLYFSLGQAAVAVRQTAGIEQIPSLTGQQVSLAIADATSLPSADGFIAALDEEDKAQLWLAGLPATVVENYGASLLEVQAEGDSPLLQVRSREGLTFKTRLSAAEGASPLQVGQLVQERVRILPRNVGLTVAIDASLERIERVDATSAFSAIPKVSSVKAGEQPADFLFGKKQPPQTLTASLSPLVTNPPLEMAQNSDSSEPLPNEISSKNLPVSPVPDPQTFPAKNSYGLFYPGRDAIPSTLVKDDEAVKTAVNRMTPQLRTLLATKLLRLTANQGSSRLGVKAALELVSPQTVRLLMQQETRRAAWTPPTQASTQASTQSFSERQLPETAGITVTVGSRIQYQLTNYSDRPLYFIVLGLDAAGNAIALSPGKGTTSLEKTAIPPGENFTIPPTGIDWKLQTSGLVETHLVFSTARLTQAYQALGTVLRTDVRSIGLLPNLLEVVQGLLQDLHEASAPLLPRAEIPVDSYAMDVNAWATLSFMYQVV